MSIWGDFQCECWVCNVSCHCVTCCFFFFRLLQPLALWSSLPLESCHLCLSWPQGLPYCWRWVIRPVPRAHPWWFPRKFHYCIHLSVPVTHLLAMLTQAAAWSASSQVLVLEFCGVMRSAVYFCRSPSDLRKHAAAHPPHAHPLTK